MIALLDKIEAQLTAILSKLGEIRAKMQPLLPFSVTFADAPAATQAWQKLCHACRAEAKMLHDADIRFLRELAL